MYIIYPIVNNKFYLKWLLQSSPSLQISKDKPKHWLLQIFWINYKKIICIIIIINLLNKNSENYIINIIKIPKMLILIIFSIVTVWMKTQEVRWPQETKELYPLHYTQADPTK